jgi:hypothetical protein
MKGKKFPFLGGGGFGPKFCKKGKKIPGGGSNVREENFFGICPEILEEYHPVLPVNMVFYPSSYLTDSFFLNKRQNFLTN